MEGWRVKAGEHHVLHDHDFEFVIHIFEARFDGVVLGCTAHVFNDGRRVRWRTRVDDFDLARGEVVAVPVGA